LIDAAISINIPAIIDVAKYTADRVTPVVLSRWSKEIRN
jgi:hypothetical protein